MAVPTLVTAIAGPLEIVPGPSSPYTQQFQEAVIAGCLLLAFIATNSGGATMATNAVTDDQGQTWTRVINGVGGTNGSGFLFKMENSAANVRKVSCAIGVVTDFIEIVLVQVKNVPTATCLGAVWSNEGTTANTAWSSGANQTPTAGSSILQVAFSTTQPWTSTGSSTADTAKGYAMELDDLQEGTVAQMWQNVTATSHSPTITVAKTATWLSMAVEILAGTAGGDYSGIYCKRASASNYSGIGAATTFRYHIPTDGNLILLDASTGNGTCNITGISGVTFTEHPNSPLENAVGGDIQSFHADNVTPSRTANAGVVTLASGSNTGGVLWLRDIVGAAAAPLDATTSATGTQNPGDPQNLTALTVTPTVSNAYCTCYIDHNSGSETGMVDTSINFLIPYANQDGSSTSHYTMDSGLAAKVSSAAVTFAFTRDVTRADQWEALGASYKPAAAGGGSDMPYQPRALRASISDAWNYGEHAGRGA